MSVQPTPASAAECISAVASLVVNDVPVEEILDYVYESCSPFIPYNRISWAEILEDQDIVRARWARADVRMLLRRGYSAKLTGSSLLFVMQQRKARIMDDLAKYLDNRPTSRSTQLMLVEGIRSSLTCPLFVGATSLGFMFFSSSQPDVYSNANCSFAMDIAKLVSLRIGGASHDHNLAAQATSNILAARHLPIHALKSGMVIGEALRAKNGNLLLASGHTLSAHSIERLTHMASVGEINFSEVEISEDAFAGDARI